MINNTLFSVQELIDKYGQKNILIAVFVTVGVIILLIVARQVRLKKNRQAIANLENRLAAIKSLPIQYRLGRVQNIAKKTPELMDQYNAFEARHDKLVNVQRDEISIMLNEIDEKVYAGKLWGINKKLNELKEKVDIFESDANQLLSEVEAVTEIENVQRVSIIHVKEKFRAVQENYHNARYKLEAVAQSINDYCEEINHDFVDLETMMNQQHFDDAKHQCEMIDTKVDFLAANIRDLPTYLSLAKGYIPAEIEKIQNRIVDLKSRGFSLTRIDAENRVLDIQEALSQVEEDILALNISEVGETLNNLTAEIAKLNEEFEVEEAAQSEFNVIYQDVLDKANDLNERFEYAVDELNKLKKLYVIEDETLNVSAKADTLQDIMADMARLKEMISTREFSYQEVVEKLKELSKATDSFDTDLQNFFAARDQMYLTENRALDELENINIVLLEIKSQIKNKQLPMINESYKDYIADSYKKASEIQFLCKSRPIILESLTQQVDIARDIIYKLYDNIHNLIVTADMVEEAIVFGNRYRSSFLEVNTELTKAEILFRNGEYTKALSTAVDIIEKIKPGSYERLVKKSKITKDPRDMTAA